MNNIFENAYFGKFYKTRDGRKALYHCFDGQYHRLFTEERCDFSPYCDDNGKHLTHTEGDSPFDIISEWTIDDKKQAVLWNNLSEEEKSNIMLDVVSSRKPIDKKELDILAEEYATKYAIPHTSQFVDMKNGFKAGYRKGIKSKI